MAIHVLSGLGDGRPKESFGVRSDALELLEQVEFAIFSAVSHSSVDLFLKCFQLLLFWFGFAAMNFQYIIFFAT